MQLENCAGLFAPFASGTLFAGFSGGADSTAALLAALHHRKRFGYRLAAIHFNHHLRGTESDREAEEARAFAAERGIEFRVIDLRLSSPGSPEAAARAARLEVWKQLAGGTPGAGVVLGHHADDRAENLLLRLARGSNATGLTGLRADATVEGVRFLRPLLNVSRAEIEAFLRGRNIRRWAEDSSNNDPGIRRNRLRHAILPALYEMFPGGREGVRHSLDMLERDAEFLESEARRRFAEIAGDDSSSFAFWKTLPPALLVRVLRLLLSAAAGNDRIPPAALPELLPGLLASESPELRRIPAGGGIELLLRGDRLSVALPSPVPPPEEPRPWRRCEEPEFRYGGWIFSAAVEPGPGGGSGATASADEACFDAESLPETLWIEPAHPGDRLIPFGRTRETPLKKLRTGRKIPAASAPPTVRLEPGGTICWAPHIRHSALAAVRPETRWILRLKVRELPAGKPETGPDTAT